MYITLETFQNNHGMSLMPPWRVKTLRFAGDQCTGKDLATEAVMPPGRAKSLQNHWFYKLFWHFELVQNMKSLKIDSNFPSEWKPWNQWKNSGPRKPCCGCSAGNISDLGDHHDVNSKTMCKEKPCCGCSAGNNSHFERARCFRCWLCACHWPYPVGIKTVLWLERGQHFWFGGLPGATPSSESIIIGLLVIIIIFNQRLNHEISTNIWSSIVSKLSKSNWVLPSNWKFVE